MEHVDWIVSFVIFVFVVLIVITAIPRFLPDITSQEEIYTSKMVYSDLIEKIDVYTIFSTDENKVYSYFLEIDNNYGRANTNYILDNNMAYGTVKQKAKFYNFDSNQINTKTLLFKEDFIDENNLRNFSLKEGEIISFKGEAYAYQETTIETKEEYSNFYSQFIFEPLDVNIFFNYVNTNNFSLCELSGNNLNLYDRNSSGLFLKDTVDVNVDENLWVNLSISSNYKGVVNCTLNGYVVDTLNQTSINKGKIIITNVEAYFLSSFEVYADNYLKKTGNLVETNYFDVTVNGQNLEIETHLERENIGRIDITYPLSLNNSSVTDNKPGIIKDSTQKHRAVIFPNLAEMIIVADADENIDFYLNLDFNISFTSANKVVLENEILNKYVGLDFFNSDNKSAECSYEEITDGFRLICEEKTFIKLRLNLEDVTYPTIRNYKNKETLITYEKIIKTLEKYQEENSYEYYIKIYNNKEEIIIGEYNFAGNFKLLERASKYLTSEGREEIVKVLIKPN